MRKNIKYIISIIIVLVIAIIGVSYAAYTSTLNLSENKITTGRIDVKFKNDIDKLSIKKMVPLYDEEGKIEENYLDFSVDVKVV